MKVIKVDEFLVRCIENKNNFWIDLNNGQQFEKCKIPYTMAKHGLCGTLNRKVLKKTTNDGFEPLVFMSVEKINPKLPKKGISFPYKNDDGARVTWTLISYEIIQAIGEMEEGWDDKTMDKKICIKLFCPREVAKKLRYKLEGGLIEKIEKEIGGDINGNRKRRTKVGVTTSSRTSYVKTVGSVSRS